ncbi:unnamed protein product [Penicillium pancosmium]
MSSPDFDANLQANDDSRGKRVSRRTSRLTSQQVQHKRDLDRASQQAYRQRVKSRIKNLEDELAHVKATSGNGHQNLLHEITSLRDENRHLKACLQSIRQLADGGASQTGDDTGLISSGQPEPSAEARSLPRTGFAFELQPISPSHDRVDPSDKLDINRNADDIRPQNEYMATASHEADAPSPSHATTQDHDIAIHFPTQNVYTLGEGQFLDSNVPTSSRDFTDEADLPLLTTHETPSPAVHSRHEFKLPASMESVMPKHIPGTYPIEKIILNFIASRRTLAARGLPAGALLGPDYPLVQGFVNPENIRGVHPTCQTLTEILLTFRDVALPEKLAFMFVMFRTLRWQLSSSRFDYEQMPRWLRPTALQITVPHSAWIDNIPWPQMRDAFIESPSRYPYSTFSALYSPNVTVNWPYDPMDAVKEVENGMILNPIFEKHIRRLKNWKLSSRFEEYLPGLAEEIHR